MRVAYAKNQQLPQGTLKASYGLNGLGENSGIIGMISSKAALSPGRLVLKCIPLGRHKGLERARGSAN